MNAHINGRDETEYLSKSSATSLSRLDQSPNKRKKDADAYHATVTVSVMDGTHTADGKSITVAEAADRWIVAGEGQGLERATLRQYWLEHARLEKYLADATFQVHPEFFPWSCPCTRRGGARMARIPCRCISSSIRPRLVPHPWVRRAAWTRGLP
jgi:hypothetical protein